MVRRPGRSLDSPCPPWGNLTRACLYPRGLNHTLQGAHRAELAQTARRRRTGAGDHRPSSYVCWRSRETAEIWTGRAFRRERVSAHAWSS